MVDPPSKIPDDVLDAIREFPVEREVLHCGRAHPVSPFQMYFRCPVCRTEIKLRGFSAAPEVADLFDAVFAWMKQPGVSDYVRQRQQELEEG
jgi:hypothetical protein